MLQYIDTNHISFPCSVKAPENVQKKLAQNEKLRKLKTEAIEKKVKVSYIYIILYYCHNLG